jgi:hypothetical protein
MIKKKIGNIANIVFVRVRSFEERLLNTLAAYVYLHVPTGRAVDVMGNITIFII